jgi:hypothetical protein
MKMTDMKSMPLTTCVVFQTVRRSVITPHSQISLIEVLTLSITRLCFPSWSWVDTILCDMLVQRVWWHPCKVSRIKLLTRVRIFVWANGHFARFVWGRAWIKNPIYYFYHTTSAMTRRRPWDVPCKVPCPGVQNSSRYRRSKSSILESTYSPLCSIRLVINNRRTFAYPVIVGDTSLITFDRRQGCSPNFVGRFLGIYSTCLWVMDGAAFFSLVQ